MTFTENPLMTVHTSVQFKSLYWTVISTRHSEVRALALAIASRAHAWREGGACKHITTEEHDLCRRGTLGRRLGRVFADVVAPG